MENLRKFPLVEKALDEQRGIFSRFDEGLPSELEQATHRTLALLDSCLDAPDSFKEDVMAASILMNCPPYIVLKSPRIGEDYNAHVQSMLNHHVNGEGLTGSDEGLVQIYGALFIAHGEIFLAKIKDLRDADPQWVEDVRENLEEYNLDRLEIQSRIAPRLFALETALMQETLTALDSILNPPTNPAPPSRKHNGPAL